MVDKRTRILRGKAALIALFLSAACSEAVDDTEPMETFDEPAEEREALDCDIQMACGQASTEAECTRPGVPGSCAELNEAGFERCLDAMRDALEGVEDESLTCEEAQDYRAQCGDSSLYVDWESCATTAGRPLFIDGEQALPVAVRTGRTAVSPAACAAEHWLRCAQLEAASVPAFRRLSSELARLSAPDSLLEAAQHAADEEVRHTHLCLSQANALAPNEAFSLRPMPDAPVRADITVERLAVEALVEGCIAEGSAAAWAAAASDTADGPPAKVLRTIASDELRHATLSWRVIGWALRRQPQIAARLLATLDDWEREEHTRPAAPSRPDLQRFGVLSPAKERAITRELVASVVRPTLEALCHSHARATARA